MTAPLVAILAFVAAAGVLTITPGLDTALVLRTAAREGARTAAAAAIGVATGCLSWGALAALGIIALLAASPIAFTALKWAGAAYLLCMGIGLLLRPRAAWDTAPQATARAGGALRRGFLTNMLNPKVGLFYAAFLPQFIPPNVNAAAFAMLLAAIHVALTGLWFALLIATTARIARWLAQPRVARILDRFAGCVFVAFGLKLALSERG
jgi:RhtB (resistance to homoserine/threonine) family protein